MKFSVQLDEERIRVAHAVQNGVRRQPQIRIDRLGALQPALSLRLIDALLVNPRLDLRMARAQARGDLAAYQLLEQP